MFRRDRREGRRETSLVKRESCEWEERDTVGCILPMFHCCCFFLPRTDIPTSFFNGPNLTFRGIIQLPSFPVQYWWIRRTQIRTTTTTTITFLFFVTFYGFSFAKGDPRIEIKPAIIYSKAELYRFIRKQYVNTFAHGSKSDLLAFVHPISRPSRTTLSGKYHLKDRK